jgi:hypothetical protein
VVELPRVGDCRTVESNLEVLSEAG